MRKDLKPCPFCGNTYMELISREEVARVFKSNTIPYSMWKVIKEIAQLPIIESRPKGKWILVEDRGYWWYKCSLCEGTSGYKTNYCHNCGADMRGEE